MTTEEVKQILRDAGYYVDNLWHIEDVQQNYDCTDKEAMKVLEASLEEEYINGEIFVSIDNNANALGLKRLTE